MFLETRPRAVSHVFASIKEGALLTKDRNILPEISFELFGVYERHTVNAKL